jgi:methylated-DNA-protein-cysteine methyltransferase related protein
VSRPSDPDQLYEPLYQVIRQIPRGSVATYAQIAALVGMARGGRVAAAALKVSRPAHRLPWHRVVGRAAGNRGRIAIHNPAGAAKQRLLLHREGVEVTQAGTIDLLAFGWLPVDAGTDRLMITAKLTSRASRTKSR